MEIVGCEKASKNDKKVTENFFVAGIKLLLKFPWFSVRALLGKTVRGLIFPAVVLVVLGRDR